MNRAYDTVVIGAGHNGLVCAHALAQAGDSVLVLEASDSVGGYAAHREFAPGYQASRGAHYLHQFPDSLLKDLDLAKHGLTFAADRIPTCVIGNGRVVSLDGANAHGVSPGDAAAWRRLTSQLERFGRFMARLQGQVPPRLGTTAFADRLQLLKLGLRLRLVGRKDMREFLRIAGMNVYDLARDELSDPLLQAALGMDAILGSNYGPRSPGSVLTLLTRRGNEAATAAGCRLPSGGLAGFSSALAEAARAAGVTICCDSPVTGIVVEDDVACGVELASGEHIVAGRVVSSVDPRQTFLQLLGTSHLDTGFVRRVDHHRQRGITAKLHLALDGLPAFTGLSPVQHGHRLLLAPSLDAIESAYNASKYGEVSERPVLEVLLPTVHDPSLAPQGHHVLSAVVSYSAYDTKTDLATARQALLDGCLRVLQEVAPCIQHQIRASELLLPKDLEKTNRSLGGHWHHGELAFDQFLMVRPFPGAAQYESPVRGLFLCGAGSHPGGGLTGLPGRIAAERIQKVGAP